MKFSPRSRWAILLAWAAGMVNVTGRAEVVWSGLGLNSNWTTATNWQGNVAPANDGAEQIVFGNASNTSVVVNTSQSIRRLRFDFTTGGVRSYSLSALGSAALTVGSDGIEVRTASGSSTSVEATMESSLSLVLGSAQTWTVEANGTLTVNGAVSGTGALTLSGAGLVSLAGNNTYSGGTTLSSGALRVESNNALGTGSLTISGPAAFYSSGARTIANALNLNAALIDLLPYGGDLHFTGTTTLGANTTLRNYGQPVYFDGAIGESGLLRSLTVSGASAVVLSGVNTYSGGSASLGGALLFRNATSVPAVGFLSSSNQGYIGIGFTTGVQAGFVAKFNPVATFGTIGFDTDPSATNANTFNDPIDLTTLNSARIGTATRATFSPTAIITPALTGGYRFGGNGGSFRLESKLTGANALSVDSSNSLPLTLTVTNTSNDYTSTTSVTRSALVFDAGAISSGSANGSFVLGTGGYIGTLDPNVSLSTWLNKFAASSTTGVVGFDSSDVANPRTLNGVFDLSSFTGGTTSIALGTSTAAILSGTISLPAGQTNYQFTGYKGGWLTVNTVLSGARGMIIGDPSGNYPEYNPSDLTRISTVFINGSNSHTGGNTLYSGRLVLSNANALGTGSLTVDGSGASVLPRLETSSSGAPSFANQLVVKDDFEIGGSNAFTWAGNILNGTSTGTIQKTGAYNLTLSGTNSAFSGGFFVSEGTLTFASNTAPGTGELNLGYGNGAAAFTSATPTVSRLVGSSASSSVSVASGTTLTIDQASSTTFRGQIQGQGGIVKAGAGTLRLESTSTFSGGTLVNAGMIDAASTGALGTGSITLNGTTSHLKLESGVTLANSLAFGANGGRLSGYGTFGSNVVVGTNSVIAPGGSVGTLTFSSGLTLTSGGAYDLEIQNALGGPGVGWDFVQVNGPLTFNATTGSPFTLNLISLNSSGTSGSVSNFASSNSYAWAIASATSFVGFDASTIAINTTNFTSALNGGTFNLSTSGNNLLLNFTPVPEPSTWALLVSGLALMAFGRIRRRR